MPHFYIDTDDGKFFCRDDEGAAYSDLDRAEAMAVRTLPEMAGLRFDANNRVITATVRDENGAIVLTASMKITIERDAGRPLKETFPPQALKSY